MRSLYEIITDAKDGNMPTHEECYYAMLAYDAMFYFDHKNLLETLLAEKQSPDFIRKLRADNSHKMYSGAMGKSPKEWLGWNNDPANPEYQKMRRAGEKLLNKVIAQQGAGEA